MTRMANPRAPGRLALPHLPSPYKGEENDGPSFCQRITEPLQSPTFVIGDPVSSSLVFVAAPFRVKGRDMPHGAIFCWRPLRAGMRCGATEEGKIGRRKAALDAATTTAGGCCLCSGAISWRCPFLGGLFRRHEKPPLQMRGHFRRFGGFLHVVPGLDGIR